MINAAAISKKPKQKIMFTLILLLGVFLGMGIVAYFVIKEAVQRTIEQQAVAFAEIAAIQVTTARSVYAQEIAGKLQQDGYGPHVDSARHKGFVPIPSQFLKLLGEESARNTAELFQYKPVSKWNLDAGQGLSDDFLRWAWPQIERQDQPDPAGPIHWKPAWRFEEENGQRILRYLSPDPASQASCVACHNSYETKPEIVAHRQDTGTPPGKQWKQHQLLGAISLSIPLSKVEARAAAQVKQTSILIFAILLGSMLLTIWFSRQLALQESSLDQIERELRRSEKEAEDAKALLLAKQDVERAFNELSAYLQAIDRHAIVSVTDPEGRIIQVNQKFCEVSGFSEEELIGCNHRLINSGLHPKSFFADMWQTISSGEIWRGQCCNRAKSGALYWVDSSIVPFKDTDGRIVRYISIRLDITEHKHTEQRMAHLANHDALTGLPNRNLLEDRIQSALAQCRRNNTLMALMFIDLDRFKPINDTLGHKVGDLLLVEISRRLRSCVREVDTVSRHGGDEFIVLLAGIENAANAELLAVKLLESLIAPCTILDHALSISASMGIAIYPADGECMESLLKHSDLAMYAAKQKGGNSYHFYTPDMHK